MEEDPVFIGILMTSHYFDNPAYSGELTISDNYVVELKCQGLSCGGQKIFVT